jgi:UDP-glucose 4-epimerase
MGIGHGALPEDVALAGWAGGEIDASNLDSLGARPDAVVHLAGGSAVGRSLLAPDEDFQRTVATTARLLDWLRVRAPEAALVLASSAAVYGDVRQIPITEAMPCHPVSPYGRHKMMMENAAGESGLRCVSLRLFSVYGPGLRKQLVWELCNRLANGERELRLGGTGVETRDWLHISDAAAMLADAIPAAIAGGVVLNGCTGAGISVAETARAIMRGFDVKAELHFSGETRKGDPVHLVGDPAKAINSGLKTLISAADGLETTAAVMRQELRV